MVRSQIGHGADWIKIYADYRWGPTGAARPTFSPEALALAVRTARLSGALVAAHATTAEGMRNAILAGVDTIEHGDLGTPELFRLMAEKKIALCPTLSAGEAISQYGGWKKGAQAEPPAVQRKRATFKAALAADDEITVVSNGPISTTTPLPPNVRTLVSGGSLPRALWMQVQAPRLLRRLRADVVHFTNGMVPLACGIQAVPFHFTMVPKKSCFPSSHA